MITSPDQLEVSRQQARELEEIIKDIRGSLGERTDLADEMVAGYASRLRKLRLDMDTYIGVGGPSETDLVVRVESPDISSEGAPSTILVDTLERLRKALSSSYIRVSGGQARGPGRTSDEIRVASEPRVVWLGPGSLRIGVDLPASFHLKSVEKWMADPSAAEFQSPIQKSVAFLLAAASWASSDQPVDAIETTIPDSGIRKVILEQVRQLSPTPRGRVSALSIEGDPAVVIRPILLTSDSRIRARQGAYPGENTQEFEDLGTLRRVSVDLDKDEHLFELRGRPDSRPPIKGDFPEELRARVFDAIHRKYRVKARGILETRVGQHAREILHLEEFERMPDDG